MPIQVLNQTRQRVLADQAEVARTFWSRGRGLMGRRSLPAGYALIIYPEWSIHTFFMRIPIDVLFIDRDECVIGLRHGMRPYLPYAGVSPWRGHYVIELPAGVLSETETVLGDRVSIAPPL